MCCHSGHRSSDCTNRRGKDTRTHVCNWICIEGCLPPPGMSGCVDITALRLKYREEFEVVLDINHPIKIEHGSKIGVCGRTGSGKSSILVSIFRIFEPMPSSKLSIDGLDFKQLGLRDLRSNLSIITQTPILFGDCTLRFNLDPFDLYTDDE
eukprot:272894_1